MRGLVANVLGATGASRALGGLIVGLLAATVTSAAPTDMNARVQAQRAIEEVLWMHRSWPLQNPGPKPPLSVVMPDSALRDRVEDELRKSAALEKYWGQSLGPADLQAELDRMARDTRDGIMLRNLFSALGDDPALIAECLARTSLADRLLRQWYASDDRFHGDLRRKVKRILGSPRNTETLRASGATITEVIWLLSDEKALSHPSVRPGSDSALPAFAVSFSQLARATASLPSQPSGITEAAEDDYGLSVEWAVDRGPDWIRIGRATWTKRSFEEWWSKVSPSLPAVATVEGGVYSLPEVVTSGCTPQDWKMTRWGAPGVKVGHYSVWTGTEMIVLGGNTWEGGRYNPATDTWRPTDYTTFPDGGFIPGTEATALWTGTEMIVYGGRDSSMQIMHAGQYNPTTNRWTYVTLTNRPVPRFLHSAVWTGFEMIIWGGVGPGFTGELNDGGRFDPVTNTWVQFSGGAGVPSPRSRHSAVWANGKMIVWGGGDINQTTFHNDGGVYDPVSNTWASVSTGLNVPSARMRHSAVWTGSEMIVWGGVTSSIGTTTNSGGRYSLASNAWTPTSLGPGVPSARSGQRATWTGSEMLIWGGSGGPNGSRYKPGNNTWTSLPPPPSGVAANGTAVWTGTEMFVWGGGVRTGGRYRLSSNTWTPIGTGPLVPSRRVEHSMIWTGVEMIVWGGNPGPTAGDARYLPATDTWVALPPAGIPSAYGHACVWTGTEMLVWGGANPAITSLGARFSPQLNSWAPMNTGSGVLDPRAGHDRGEWTGTEMLVWGGASFTQYFGTGGRYSPTADSWTAISNGSGTPSPRSLHTSVWTGTEMIVWGGVDAGGQLNTGGRYVPATDSWSPTSLGANVPTPRNTHVAVWEGQEMIIWGPYASPMGARYSPSTDQWRPMSVTGAVASRGAAVGVWTGQEMLISGGQLSFGDDTTIADHYSPATNTWGPTVSDDPDRPDYSAFPEAVWTGTQMIIWGGYVADVPNHYFDTGGLWCPPACTTPAGVATLMADRVSPDIAQLSWTTPAETRATDVIRGSLAALRSSGGEFAIATNACLANNSTGTTVDDATMPPAGDGYWYVVRPVGCLNGSYDSGGTSQIGARDAEVAASPAACE